MNNFNKLIEWSRNLIIVYSLTIFIHIILIKHVAASTEHDSVIKHSQMIPFYWMVFIVGGCIAITLTYVSFRKYKAEKNKEKNKDKDKSKGKSVD